MQGASRALGLSVWGQLQAQLSSTMGFALGCKNGSKGQGTSLEDSLAQTCKALSSNSTAEKEKPRGGRKAATVHKPTKRSRSLNRWGRTWLLKSPPSLSGPKPAGHPLCCKHTSGFLARGTFSYKCNTLISSMLLEGPCCRWLLVPVSSASNSLLLAPVFEFCFFFLFSFFST